MSIFSAIGPIVGGALGFLGSKEQGDAMRDAAAEAKAQFYGPGMRYVPGILGDASAIYGQGGFAPQANPLELLGRSNALGYAEGQLPGMIDAAQQSWMSGLNPGLNPYVGAMIESAQNDLTQDYLRNVLPSISDRAQAVGGYGGSRQGVAQGLAAEGLLEAQGDVTASLLHGAHRDALAQQRAAWGMSPMMTELGFRPAQAQQDIGGMYRGDASRPAQNLMGYQGVVNPYVNPGANTNPMVAPSPWMGAAGGAMAGWQFGNEIMKSGLLRSFNPTPNVTNPVPGDAYMPAAGYTPGAFGF